MKAGKYEIILSFAFVAMLLLLLFPLSPMLLDLGLIVNLVFALMALFLIISIHSPLEFSSFPSLLLILTLFRLGLNIASTRLILTEGIGGQVIATFGNFVTSGSVWIGFLLFALLSVINFIVITKGAGRIAEVAARFTLEALPGKQMSIDSALSAGIMNGSQAKEEKTKLKSEMEFFGAMDGASKFVRGDAIASLVIIALNIVGGIIIGMTSHDMGMRECLTTYTKLTIGDGLVTQIPALMMSLGGALMVSRASEGSLAESLLTQLFQQKRVLQLAGGAIFCLSFIPGMPIALMIVVATAFIFSSFLFKEKAEETKTESLSPPVLEVLLGYKMLSKAEQILAKVPCVREEITEELGLSIPSIHIRDHLSLPSHSYVIKVKGSTVYSGEGDDAQEIIAKLKEKIAAHAHELIHRQDIALMIERAKKTDGAVVQELIPDRLQLGDLLKVCQNLLREGFAIKDFVTILETIADHLPKGESVDCDLLTEFVRQKLFRGHLEEFLDEKRNIHAITLERQVEQMLMASIKKTPFGASLVLKSSTIEKIGTQVADLLKSAEEKGLRPIVLTNVTLRKSLKQLLERQKAQVISYEEASLATSIKAFGSISNEVLI